jgi:glycine/D-amino acid oxidase-like deaminating enzyme
MEANYLIVGQGISGTFLSWYLQKAGASVIVMDENKSNTASGVAAGLVNPVTGRRLVKSWMIDELMPFAWNAYKQFGNELQIDCIAEVSLKQFFSAPDMQDAFNKRLKEEPEYLSAPDGSDWRQFFNYPFAWGNIQPCYIADVKKLTAAWRAQLIHQNKLIEETFEPPQLVIDEGYISYKNIHAQKIIFCDGAAGLHNPWFNRLPYSLNKGEALILRISQLPTDHIYKFKQTLIPVEPAEQLFWFGSSYEWTYDDELPSPKFRAGAAAELNHFLKLPYTVVDHVAAVRPANVERRPFVGIHPAYPQLAILNGMGTKGCSLAPYFGYQLAQHLVKEAPLQQDVNVNRFQRVLAG